MLIAVIAITPVYVAAVCAGGMLLGRRLRRLSAEQERSSSD
jgi:hypothetical protein